MLSDAQNGDARMTQLATLARTELLEAVGDYLAKRAGSAVHIHGLTTTVGLDADPTNPSIQVEFTPKLHEDAPDIDFRSIDPEELLP